MNNLHISLTEMRFESRVLKETDSIRKLKDVEQVYIASLGADDLDENEVFENGVELKRFRLRSRSWSKNSAVQVFKFLEYCVRVALHFRSRNIGLVNVHELSLLPLGFALKHFYRAKLVYDAHELETETEPGESFRKSLAKRLEKLFIASVDHTIVVSENIADWYAKTYQIARPTVVMNAPRLCHPERSNHFRDAFRLRENQKIVLYQGLLSRSRGVDFMLEAFHHRPDDRSVIVFMGYGEMEAEIQALSEKSNNVFYHRAVAPDNLLSYTASADIGIFVMANTCLSYFYCMPNKLFEYAMAGLPVVVSNLQEMSEMVKKYEMGIVTDGYDAAAISVAIDRLGAEDIKILSRNSKRAALENAWEVQERKMLDAYRSMISGLS